MKFLKHLLALLMLFLIPICSFAQLRMEVKFFGTNYYDGTTKVTPTYMDQKMTSDIDAYTDWSEGKSLQGISAGLSIVGSTVVLIGVINGLSDNDKNGLAYDLGGLALALLAVIPGNKAQSKKEIAIAKYNKNAGLTDFKPFKINLLGNGLGLSYTF